MPPPTLPPRPPLHLAVGSRPTPGTPASMHQLGLLPSGGGGVGADHIIDVIGRIRSRVLGETVRRDDAGCPRPPSKRRLQDDTTARKSKCRLDAGSPYTFTTPKSSRRGDDVCPHAFAPKNSRSVDDDCTYTVAPKSSRRVDDDSTYTFAPKSSRRRTHPVEVIARIRDLTSGASALDIGGGGTSLRVGTREFTLDGASASEEEGLEGFYGRFVRSRVEGVRAGAKCTVMVYGPTGSGKSHTMFGCADQPGIVYWALWDILEVDGGGAGVQVSFLEIYNEEVYDLLPNPKVKLQVMGTKAKDATYISGNEAGKIAKQVVEVEKRRAVRNTNCNTRSSRSHCMVILDVPSVGGRLVLVDMAGSENIEAVGRTGKGAKSETGSINTGNTALKRVIESIANGDSHVPFRDSKLTMLLRDSFDDERSKILMILCANPDRKEEHKTISTLEYGARAKCITRFTCTSTPRDKIMCPKVAQNATRLKDEELARLRTKLSLMEARQAGAKDEEINVKVAEEIGFLWGELRVMAKKMFMLQQELLAVKQRLQEVEREKLYIDE